jgi:hypothetical protein
MEKYYNYFSLYYAVNTKKKRTISVRDDKDSPCLQVYDCIVNLEKLTPITKDVFDKVYDKILKKFKQKHKK